MLKYELETLQLRTSTFQELNVVQQTKLTANQSLPQDHGCTEILILFKKKKEMSET